MYRVNKQVNGNNYKENNQNTESEGIKQNVLNVNETMYRVTNQVNENNYKENNQKNKVAEDVMQSFSPGRSRRCTGCPSLPQVGQV